MSEGSSKLVSSKAAENAVEAVRSAISSVFGPAASELGILLGNQMKYWRFKNALGILDKVSSELEIRGVSEERIAALPFGSQFLVLEAMSFEEDETIQSLWARLIASALDTESTVKIEKRYIDLLKSLSPCEAGLLELLWNCEKEFLFKSREEVQSFNEKYDEMARKIWRHFPMELRKASIQNLIRLRCVTVRHGAIDIVQIFENIHVEDRRSRRSIPIIKPDGFGQLINELLKRNAVMAGSMEPQENTSQPLYHPGSTIRSMLGSVTVPELSYMLTALGNDLMASCFDIRK